MSGAAFILINSILVAGLFSAAFVLVGLYSRRHTYALWFAGCFGLGMLYAVLEFVLPVFYNEQLGVFLGHTAFLGSLLLLNVGLSRRFDVPPPRHLLLAVFATSLVISALILNIPRETFLRMFLYQAPFFVLQAIAAWTVYQSRDRTVVDNLLAGFLAASSLHYLSKPFVAMMVGGPGATPTEYITTTYAMISQSMGAVLVVAAGLLILAMLVSDIVRDIVARSETDILSGLLNRRGFEDRLDDLVRQHGRNGMPLSVVICDLDRFKMVNDNWGHGVGDILIAGFAGTLHDCSAEHHIPGRIGGEEFAVVLPGANLAAARLFAEAARATFSANPNEGLPTDVRFTASFGVAEMAAGETRASLLSRADAALYEAKRAGRDCVRVSRVHQVFDDGRSIPAS